MPKISANRYNIHSCSSIGVDADTAQMMMKNKAITICRLSHLYVSPTKVPIVYPIVSSTGWSDISDIEVFIMNFMSTIIVGKNANRIPFNKRPDLAFFEKIC